MERVLIMKWIALAATTLVLTGCSGKIVTYTSCTAGECKGVPFYKMKEVTDRYVYDRIIGADGKAIRIAGGPTGKDCILVQVEEKKLIATDTTNYLYYDAGFFETSKFAVDVNPNGTISKVSTESTPAIKETAEVIATLATAYRTINPVQVGFVGGTPQCTSKAP